MFSPAHPHSNGKMELAIKVVRITLEKAKQPGSDPYYPGSSEYISIEDLD